LTMFGITSRHGGALVAELLASKYHHDQTIASKDHEETDEYIC
jgi:hypothetical protein